ncbi:MAG: spore coat protein CotJB [Lachnospiraceae bacterium]|nr:spore coat protein CotJB [Lachnospiraceae bacterium]
MAASRTDMMHRITELSFVLDDMRLFLDTHPDCREGLEYYNKYAALREEAVAEYTKLYGPLRFYDMTDDCKWQWATGPWPWEGVC